MKNFCFEATTFPTAAALSVGASMERKGCKITHSWDRIFTIAQKRTIKIDFFFRRDLQMCSTLNGIRNNNEGMGQSKHRESKCKVLHCSFQDHFVMIVIMSMEVSWAGRRNLSSTLLSKTSVYHLFVVIKIDWGSHLFQIGTETFAILLFLYRSSALGTSTLFLTSIMQTSNITVYQYLTENYIHYCITDCTATTCG